MAKKKLYKSKSNFTLRRLHQSGSYGNIYERDYTTIVNSFDSPEGQIPVYNSPSFKLTVRGGMNGQKKYKMGNWVNNPKNCSNNGNFWTLSCMPEFENTNNDIRLKPNSKKLTDFACYGSSSELIRTSITNIVTNFPAELYITNKKLSEIGILESDDTLIGTKINDCSGDYLIENPLYIDLIQKSIPEDSKVSPLRYFSVSYDKYDIINSYNEINHVDGYKIIPEPDKDCLYNGDLLATIIISSGNKSITIKSFHYDGIVIYVSDTKDLRIRPNQTEIENFFKNLEPFEKILLNQYTNYTSTFETYLESEEDGWYMIEKKYKWPVSEGDWNISINGIEYTKYVDDLSLLAVGYDEMFTDAIWRTMTHESIANMDLTKTEMYGDEELLDNSSKMKETLNIIGRQFDEIKNYADNIKRMNTITYDQNDNMPDYFLSDNVELSGWETKNILSNIGDDIKTKPMYGAITDGFTASDANNEFMRRLKLNSKSILKEKGTKRCIEDLLAIFGFHSYDWFVKYYDNPCKNEKLFEKSYIIVENVYVANGYANSETPEDTLNSVKRLNQLKDNYIIGDINDVNSFIDVYDGIPVAEATIDNKTRLIPWFNKNTKYDGGLYFQMKGGWARNDGDTRKDGTPEPSIYDYTVSKIHYVKNLDELYSINYSSIDENGVYYVNSQDKYLRIKDILKYNTSDGWETLTDEELIQYKNIVDNNKGNNPHTGEYDDGISYVESFGTLFKDSSFKNSRNDDTSDRFNYGFNIERQSDSTKCCLFLGEEINNDIDNNGTLRGKHRIEPYNLFSDNKSNIDGSHNEECSLSIINSKEIDIVFDIAYRELIENDIIPYLKQIIPSTSIFSYRFEKIKCDNIDDIYDAKSHKVVCDGDICPIYGIT